MTLTSPPSANAEAARTTSMPWFDPEDTEPLDCFSNQELEDIKEEEHPFRIKRIIGRQGSLDSDHGGAKFNVLVEWEEGSNTYEPLGLLAEKGSKARKTVDDDEKDNFIDLERPRLFYFLVVLHFVLSLGGFVPTVLAYRQEGKWWVNPVKRPKEWANEHDSVMKVHAVISFIWIAFSFLQFVVTPQLLFRQRRQQAPSGGKTTMSLAKKVHQTSGYTGAALLVAFAVNSNHLTLINGVAGLVLNNFLAVIVGSMMMWHLCRALLFILQKNIRGHVSQVCGLLSWTCYPGIIRLVVIAPYQYFFFNDSECDVMNTSGVMVGSFPVSLLLLALLRWAATGERYQHKSYIKFYIFMVTDLLLGIWGNTLFRCNPDGAMLEQTPGKPWVLENWKNAPWIFSATQ